MDTKEIKEIIERFLDDYLSKSYGKYYDNVYIGYCHNMDYDLLRIGTDEISDVVVEKLIEIGAIR